MEDIFGPIIDQYSRQDMLNDGELVDVSKMAEEAGIRFPVAVTRPVWEGVVKPDKSALNRGESEEGRLWDVLYMLRMAIGRSKGSVVNYSLIATEKGKKKTRYLKAVCGPGDTPDPVITIMYPEEE